MKYFIYLCNMKKKNTLIYLLRSEIINTKGDIIDYDVNLYYTYDNIIDNIKTIIKNNNGYSEEWFKNNLLMDYDTIKYKCLSTNGNEMSFRFIIEIKNIL